MSRKKLKSLNSFKSYAEYDSELLRHMCALFEEDGAIMYAALRASAAKGAKYPTVPVIETNVGFAWTTLVARIDKKKLKVMSRWLIAGNVVMSDRDNDSWYFYPFRMVNPHYGAVPYESRTIKRRTKKTRLPSWLDAHIKRYSFVWTRDRGCCVNCGTSFEESDMNVHHVSPRLQAVDAESASNLVLLCEDCHGMVHSVLNHDLEWIASPIDIEGMEEW